jgi:hypothetical protein
VSDENRSVVEGEFQQLTGALAAFVKLREEFSQWSERATDDAERETLERVVAHIQSIESAYRNRKVLLQEKLTQ